MAYEQPEDEKPKAKAGPTMCEWNDHGETCGYRGILSPANLGRGPWYCREHFYKFRGYHDMEAEKLHGNQLPKTPLHSFAVDEMAAKLKLHREAK